VKRIILMDGGTGMELLRRSANKAPIRWSAEYLLAEPDLVRTVHADYIVAGAKTLTVNAYSATFTRMGMIGEADRVPELQRMACRLAVEARQAAGTTGADVAVSGCLPPLNGTYRPDRVRPFEENLAEYRRLVELQAPYVDFFLCETMSTADEARAAATAAAETGKPVWVSWSLSDDSGRLRSGESISHSYAALAGTTVDAVLANCSPPESISAAMPNLVSCGVPAGGYANGFKPIPRDFRPGKTRELLQSRVDLGPAEYWKFVKQWVGAGATIVGGCCEVGPEHVSFLRDKLQFLGYEVRGPSFS
jgi:S-methylmethionine-dependent homocysteine/selenocysteine methylase